jgi:hypothetical protein
LLIVATSKGVSINMLHMFKLTLAAGFFGFILSSTASAKPKYWVVRAMLTCIECGSSDTVSVLVGNTGDPITSRAKCESLKSDLVAISRKNGMKAKARCLVTKNPAKEK